VSEHSGISYSRRSLAWIIGLAGGSFALALVLTGFADDLGQPLSASADSFSYSALGHHAFYEVLARSGIKVSRRRTERTVSLDPTTALFVAEPRAMSRDPTSPEFPDAGPGDRRLTRLVAMADSQRAPLVVVLPKRLGAPSQNNPRWVQATVRVPSDEALGVFDGVEALAGIELIDIEGNQEIDCETSWGETFRVSLQSARLLREVAGIDAVVTCDGDILVAQASEAGEGRTYIVSDPDVFNNQGLGRADNARLAYALFTDGLQVSAVVFEETIHGHIRNTGLIAELLHYPLVLALAHGLLVAGLVVWSGTGRLGRPRRLAPGLGSGKQVLIDNTAQLISVAGHSLDALRRYYQQTVRAVATHYYFPTDLPEPHVLARLRAITRSRGVGTDIADVAKTIDRLGESRRERPETVIRTAVRLHAWREELMDVD